MHMKGYMTPRQFANTSKATVAILLLPSSVTSSQAILASAYQSGWRFCDDATSQGVLQEDLLHPFASPEQVASSITTCIVGGQIRSLRQYCTGGDATQLG